ncbi:MAG: TonB-dependent receptor [Bryobacteraceae bacterium]|nr:TonB-dependent receptor [Bryobacteraceae bacterium]
MFKRILSCMLLISGLAAAQDTRGTLSGRVVDTSGAVVPNVEVRAINEATGTSSSGRTNQTGNYAVPFLLPGTYRVQAEVTGFKQFQRGGIQVRVGDSVGLEITLQPGDVAERMEVTTQTPLLETNSASVGQVVDQRRLTELPVVGGNPFQLVQLAPGVVNATDLRVRNTSSPNATSQISTDGNATYSNEFSIDGVPNVRSSPYEGNSNQVAYIPPATAVSEFKVQTITYDASLGHTPGAVINVATVSGTNQLHGEVHEFLRNRALDAPSFFQNRAGQTLPVYQYNRYGASAGGPVVLPRLYQGKNRTFWFYAFEANPFKVPTPSIRTVPGASEIAGDFSALLRLGNTYQLYDPATAVAEAGGRVRRSPFANNVIPPSRINPIAKSLSRFWPAPNQAGTIDGRNNFFAGKQNSANQYQTHLGRVDHTFSDSHRIFVRVHGDAFKETKNNDFDNIANETFHERRNLGAAIDDVFVFSPQLLLNLRYGLTYFEFPERRASRGIDLTQFGFSKGLTSLIDPSLAALPVVSVDGYSSFGTGVDRTTSDVRHATSAHVTAMLGSHYMRLGGEARLDRSFSNDILSGVSPSFTFGTNWTRGPLDTSPAGPQGNGLASYLLGLPTGGNLVRLSGGEALQSRFFGIYWQDDWKVSARLTVNLGLRYEYESPLTERFNRSTTQFDFNSPSPISAQALAAYAAAPLAEVPPSAFSVRGGVLFAGANGLPRTFWTADKNNLMPRIGLAYTLNSSTVVRMGYGLFYDTNATKYPSQQPGFNQSTPLVASVDNGLTFLSTVSDAFTAGLLPARGASGGLMTNAGQGITFYPARTLNSYAQRWSFGIQQQFLREWVLDVSYVGNRGTQVAVRRDLNAIPAQYLSKSATRDQAAIDNLAAQVRNPLAGLLPGTSLNGATVGRSQLLRPYPHFTGVATFDPQGYSWYHSLQARVEKRFSRGYTVNLAYTWSKAMEAVGYLNDVDPMPERVISPNDRTHRVVVSGIYELPFGRGCKLLSTSNRFVNALAGGWQFGGVVTQQSGPPLSFGNAILLTSLDAVPLASAQRSVDRWFNIDAFDRAPGRQLGSNLRTLPSRFSGIRGDGQSMWDLSLLKNFTLREGFKLQFRAETYNALNHPNFSGPNTSPTSTAFGTVTAQNGNPRWWQMALKLSF